MGSAKNIDKIIRQIMTALNADDNAAIIRLGEQIADSPECPYAVLMALGRAYLAENRRVRALEMFERTFEATKESSPSEDFITDLYDNLAQSYGYLGYAAKAFEMYFECYRRVTELRRKSWLFGHVLFMAQCLPFSSQDLFELSRVYDGLFAGITPYKHDLTAVRREILVANRKIRVGYISPDFHSHIVMSFVKGLLEFYDREHFEVYCYSLNKKNDAVTERIRASVDSFIDVGDFDKWTLEKTAQRIYNDHIDILFDLAGHTGRTGLSVLAYKPAPVEISGIGYLGTTGLKTVDYFITDETVDPPGLHDAYFTEKPLYLPSHFCYTNDDAVKQEKGAPCLHTGYVQFASFNQYLKLQDDVLLAWREILERVPNSRLLIKTQSFRDDDLLRIAETRFKNLGFDLSRITLEKPDAYYLGRYNDVDIALDTFPYTGGGTTCDALYMGVPVVTLYSERRNTRFGLGLLHSLGLQYLAVDNLQKYIELATMIAKDTELLNELHCKLRGRFMSSAAGNPVQYVRNMEQRYREILGLT